MFDSKFFNDFDYDGKSRVLAASEEFESCMTSFSPFAMTFLTEIAKIMLLLTYYVQTKLFEIVEMNTATHFLNIFIMLTPAFLKKYK